MITINATGDTTLHTAGKYCAEDILVKVPAGGSSGGASVDTCTVVSNISYSPITVTKYENGSYVPAYTERSVNNVCHGTITNVVCGSTITIDYDNAYSITADGAEIITVTGSCLIVLKITASAGETVTLSATYVDL